MSQKIDYTEEFYESLSGITGIPKEKLTEYGQENSLHNLVERPSTLDGITDLQREKLRNLNRFVSLFSLVKEEKKKFGLIALRKRKSISRRFLGWKRKKKLFWLPFWTPKIKS